MTNKLLSDEELTAKIEQLYNKSRELGMIRTGNPTAFMVLHTLALINTQKRLAVESIQDQADDMARFIAALLIQSGGSVKVTRRTLEGIPLPSSVKFERFDNIDGSIEFRLKDEGK